MKKIIAETIQIVGGLICFMFVLIIIFRGIYEIIYNPKDVGLFILFCGILGIIGYGAYWSDKTLNSNK